ncbi:hypothetical protein [Yoonia sp. 208BN28-4]|uniref:hypothetical protein n=1 Tax=Yoonia sp. 208BN28-4 TaxID=3126505 RepID=UPI003099214A
MSYKAALAAALVVVVAAPASAQVTGGSLGIEYSTPIDGDDFGGTAYYGAIEYGFNRDFSVSADLSGYRLDNIDTDASSLTLHGVYHLNETLSVGAFYGLDKLETSDAVGLYGVEAGTEFLGGEVEGYLGQVDGNISTATVLGADGIYSFGNGFSAIGNAAFSFQDDSDVSRIAVGAQYDMLDGPQFYVEVGQTDVEVGGISDDDTFIAVGTRVAIGAQRGTTFGPRSLFEILPGF